ncbi:hypothetical protein HanIR_Chr14g0709151 [Helianthus annuus]|nr:hypothetical protein HanIR_Chr14g0709151 [Helianthus annuus]
MGFFLYPRLIETNEIDPFLFSRISSFYTSISCIPCFIPLFLIFKEKISLSLVLDTNQN